MHYILTTKKPISPRTSFLANQNEKFPRSFLEAKDCMILQEEGQGMQSKGIEREGDSAETGHLSEIVQCITLHKRGRSTKGKSPISFVSHLFCQTWELKSFYSTCKEFGGN
jgi:hypothetical protein